MKTLALGLAAVALAATTALGAPVRLDDSASPRARVDVTPRWVNADEAAGPEQLNAMVADVANLEVRLNTSKFVGRSARVFLVLPEFVPGLRSPSGMRAEWRSRGVFRPGSALPGARTLVYDGPITQPYLADILDITLFLDARHLERGLRIEPYFELELAQ